ncbi:hypothetical protein LTR70_002386 [Exophiala xenobiotica]|uniref:Tyrosinase copper-binding domain-containing protein n=1 Tax=Lithohypha guttulata TaxID=1690604 RepID=A0ABR0KMS5_9EURO|nr:hypothetical protein LTR24_001383 [Lithohypha guttulata]KAK5325414.1 hypothetical protein LTR70_002386 [Exophiala xenobiotica]
MSGGVGPRVPKDDFMRALGLEPSDARHEGLYKLMRDEAISTYTQLNASRSNLVEDKQNDPSIRPPFFWHHISRDRQIWAVTTTWQNAPVGSAQRALFDRGSTSGEHAPNWVTLWLLYSVFRSRDTRNNRSRRNGDSGSSSGSGTFWQQPVFDSYTDPLRQF